MVMSVLLGLATFYYTWQSNLSPWAEGAVMAATREREALDTAAFTGSIYWLAGLAAALFPGTGGRDPEFGGGFPQAALFVACAALALVGWCVEAMM
jgi:hypothetical protein